MVEPLLLVLERFAADFDQYPLILHKFLLYERIKILEQDRQRVNFQCLESMGLKQITRWWLILVGILAVAGAVWLAVDLLQPRPPKVYALWITRFDYTTPEDVRSIISNCAIQRRAVGSSFRHVVKVASRSGSGRHWRSASR